MVGEWRGSKAVAGVAREGLALAGVAILEIGGAVGDPVVVRPSDGGAMRAMG